MGTIRGVNWDADTKKWKVGIMVRGHTYHLGRFKCSVLAESMRRAAEAKYAPSCRAKREVTEAYDVCQYFLARGYIVTDTGGRWRELWLDKRYVGEYAIDASGSTQPYVLCAAGWRRAEHYSGLDALMHGLRRAIDKE